ncbi:acyltransferase family protein [Myroides sp. LJL115]
MIYLKGLNGIRAIAALAVLFSHCNLALNNFNIKKYSLFGFDDNGNHLAYKLGEYGVTMFFVLSGFLITFLIKKEIAKTQTIDVKSFYIRRILRIWPLYYLYIILVFVTFYFFNENFPPFSTLAFYLLFFANIPYIGGFPIPLLGHFWSIGVEEQFYLFWPWLAKIKKMFKIVVYLVIGQFILRVLLWYFVPFSFPAYLSSINKFDSMMIGGLVAILLFNKNRIIDFLSNKYVQIGAWLILLSAVLNVFSFYNHVFEGMIITLVTSVIIIGQVNGNYKFFDLEKPWLDFLGILSFGIYVYHPLIIFLLQKSKVLLIIESELMRFVSVFVVVTLLSILVSHLSYKYIESSFLKLKDKFQIVRSTNKPS